MRFVTFQASRRLLETLKRISCCRVDVRVGNASLFRGVGKKSKTSSDLYICSNHQDATNYTAKNYSRSIALGLANDVGLLKSRTH